MKQTTLKKQFNQYVKGTRTEKQLNKLSECIYDYLRANNPKNIM